MSNDAEDGRQLIDRQILNNARAITSYLSPPTFCTIAHYHPAPSSIVAHLHHNHVMTRMQF